MTQSYLSFNESLVGRGNFGIPEDDEEVVIEALKEPMPLRDNWVLWEQVVQEGKKENYADATRKVTKFNTVQEFWGIWNGLPQPSELLEQKRIMRDQSNGAAVAVDALMIFKEGIAPEWEDPKNANGGHFQIQMKPNVGGGQIDEYWNNVVLGMVGGTLEPADMITGIRLVDKLGGAKLASAIRIELWFTKFGETSAVNALKRNFQKCMCTKVDGTQSSNGPSADTKPHGSMSKH
jgi:translation initiation factor 4E